MDTTFPEGDTAKLTLALPSPKTFTLALRRPAWAGEGFAVKVNGEERSRVTGRRSVGSGIVRSS